MSSPEPDSERALAKKRTPRPGISLRSKIVLALMIVVGAYAISDSIVRQTIVAPTFTAVEKAEAEEDVNRIAQALHREIDALHQFALNWASYDRTYEFVVHPNPEFLQIDLAEARLRANHIDLLYLCDLEGNVVWHSLEDPDHPGEELRLRMFPVGGLARIFLEEEKSGLLLTERGPMLVSSRRVLPGSSEGEPRGTLVLGRFLSKSLDKELSKQTAVEFDFWQLDGESELPPTEQAILDDLTSAPGAYSHETGDGKLYAYRTFEDIKGHPDFLLRANVPRDISRTGGTAMKYAVLSMAGACLIGVLALLGLLQRIVLSPVSTLTAHAVRIGQEEDFSAKLSLARNDEIGILARELDAMMGKLEQARRDLVQTARAAGMSEIATGILHNVGNVLNSVNISAAVIAERAQDLGTADLSQLARILDEHRNDLVGFVEKDPRGKHLQSFVAALAEHVSGQRSNILQELGSLSVGIDHIRELIRSQQDYAGRSELVELVQPSELFEQAIGIMEKALGVDPELVIERDFPSVSPMLVDRHKVLEILVNLLQNARQAMDSGTGMPKRLHLSFESIEGNRVLFRVKDSGVGIPRENLLRIFHLGFTTKPGGHGFGLHASANAAGALGGSLSGTSDGVGLGATFTLELPSRTNRPVEARA
jgi:sensor domain CHASE-containing protein